MQIITVTLNPVFDKTLWVENFKVGKTLLAGRSETYAGGKGVNVSRALGNFGIRSTATGIIGSSGKEGYFILLETDGICHDFYITRGSVRTNITIVSPENGRETHVREKGPIIHKTVLPKFIEKLKALKGEKNKFSCAEHEGGNNTSVRRLFIFAGSLPTGMPKNTYKTLINTVKNWNCITFLDASGDAFKEGVEALPTFIKPNAHEVKDALGFIPESRREFIKAVETFHRIGIERVMISRGREGILFSSGNGILEAKLYIEHPINTVGSGDCAVAGGTIGIVQNLTDEDTVRLACAMGAANTLTSGAGRFSNRTVHKMMKQAKIERL